MNIFDWAGEQLYGWYFLSAPVKKKSIALSNTGIMLRQAITQSNTQLRRNTVKTFSTSSAVLAGRQPGNRRRAEKKFDVDFMPKFDFDDQTTIGHNLFENIREVRQYLRKTEYELPKLSGTFIFDISKKKKLTHPWFFSLCQTF